MVTNISATMRPTAQRQRSSSGLGEPRQERRTSRRTHQDQPCLQARMVIGDQQLRCTERHGGHHDKVHDQRQQH